MRLMGILRHRPTEMHGTGAQRVEKGHFLGRVGPPHPSQADVRQALILEITGVVLGLGGALPRLKQGPLFTQFSPPFPNREKTSSGYWLSMSANPA